MRQVFLPLNFWGKDKLDRSTLWAIKQPLIEKYPQYGEYRYDIPAEWLQDAEQGNTQGWLGKFLGEAYTPDGSLLACEPPIEILKKYPKKWDSNTKVVFVPPEWKINQDKNNNWQIFCEGIKIPALKQKRAKTWGEYYGL